MLAFSNFYGTFVYCFIFDFSALRDVKIPPGPRLLILDHIQRFDSTFLSKLDMMNVHTNLKSEV
jgi:hypothetical protein